MSNNSTNNKLDDFIRESLESIEAPGGGADWDALERKLDDQPVTSEFKFNPKVVGGAIAGIAAISLIAYVINSPSTPTKDTVQPETTEEIKSVNVEEEAQANYTPRSGKQLNDYNLPTDEELGTIEFIVSNKTNSSAEEEYSSASNSEEVSLNNEASNENVVEEEPEEKNENAEDATTIVSENEIDDSVEKTGETNFLDVFNNLKDKNKVPTFGDMIDPKKGFTKPTSEEERLKKEAEKKVKEGDSSSSVIEPNKEEIAQPIISPVPEDSTDN